MDSNLKDFSKTLSAAFDNTAYSLVEVGAALKKLSAAMQAFGKSVKEGRNDYAEMVQTAADIPMPCSRSNRSQYKTLDVRHEIL